MTPAAVASVDQDIPRKSFVALAWRRFLRHHLAIIGALIVGGAGAHGRPGPLAGPARPQPGGYHERPGRPLEGACPGLRRGGPRCSQPADLRHPGFPLGGPGGGGHRSFDRDPVGLPGRLFRRLGGHDHQPPDRRRTLVSAADADPGHRGASRAAPVQHHAGPGAVGMAPGGPDRARPDPGREGGAVRSVQPGRWARVPDGSS